MPSRWVSGQDDAGREQILADRRALEERADHRHRAQRVAQGRLDRRTHPGRQHEEGPQAIDDAGDGRQHLDQEGDRPAHPARRVLDQVERRADADRRRQQQADERGHQRAVDEGGRPELLEDRVPGGAEEEADAVAEQRLAAVEEEQQDDREQGDDRPQGDHPGRALEETVGGAATPAVDAPGPSWLRPRR
jgi:hypothetical protein